MKRLWRITHVESGRSILRHMRNREQAIEYLMRIRKLNIDWERPEEWFISWSGRAAMKRTLDELQKEISGERR